MNQTMSTIALTPTSYVVLGLVALRGPSTPYDLKGYVANSIGYFWSFPHAQLYTEPARLATAGYLDEQRESDGRRRRTFSITPLGREALGLWISDSTPATFEIRDPGLLKLFFGDLAPSGGIESLARNQIRAHSDRLKAYQEIEAHLEAKGIKSHSRATLRYGLHFEEAAVTFWEQVEKGRASELG